jgi:hypothetical protein
MPNRRAKRAKRAPSPAIKKKTLSVPEAGRRYYGLGKNASYEAAKRGELPFIQIGRMKRVPVVAMERQMMETRPAKREAV